MKIIRKCNLNYSHIHEIHRYSNVLRKKESNNVSVIFMKRIANLEKQTW